MLMLSVRNDQSSNIFSFLLFLWYAASPRFAFYFLLMQDQAGWCNGFPPPQNTLVELGKVSYSLVFSLDFRETCGFEEARVG